MANTKKAPPAAMDPADVQKILKMKAKVVYREIRRKQVLHPERQRLGARVTGHVENSARTADHKLQRVAQRDAHEGAKGS